jgi:hypothetical protein
MKRLFFLALLMLLLGAAVGGPIDPESCSCERWDTTGLPFVTPSQCSLVDNLTVTVRDSDGNGISGAEIVIDLRGCDNIEVYDENTLVATTGGDGIAVLNPSAGGCQFGCQVKVTANDTLICEYSRGCVSTDWNGLESDGKVNALDLSFFATAFVATQDSCADYNGDGAVSALDLSTFAASFICPDWDPPSGE